MRRNLMEHPDVDGVAEYATDRQFVDIYEPRGWVRVDADDGPDPVEHPYPTHGRTDPDPDVDPDVDDTPDPGPAGGTTPTPRDAPEEP